MDIVAVVVTHNPQFEVVRELLDALLPQLKSVVVVDNGSDEKFKSWLNQYREQGVHGIFIGTNTGVATAQNIGVTWARRQGAECVILFDQDSLPATDMVIRLTMAMKAKQAEGCKVAAVGPRYIDGRHDNSTPFFRFRGLRLKQCACLTEDSVVPVDYLIASGCMIPLAVLDKIGGMRENLFIDYVDIEWGLRARYHCLQSYGVCSAHMTHSIGDPPIKFFGKIIPLHSPLRHYYHFRNAVLICKEPWVPLNWKLLDGWRLCIKYVFYSLFVRPRTAHWRMMTLGVWHGLRGRQGAFNSP
jgi:rhamnosyltransferase